MKLGLAEGVELAHALVASIAEQAAIPVIFIKGPVANHHRVRRPTVPSDVDVLVRPQYAARLTAELHARGWTKRPQSRAHATFVTHSETLIHAEWPCDIDVHTNYPGFGVTPTDAFDALLSQAVRVPIAGRHLPGASEVDSVLISALHSLRAPYLARSRAEYSDLIAYVTARGDRAQFLSTLADRSVDLGASGSLAPFLEDVGAPLPLGDTYDLQPLWVLRAADLSRTAEWLNHIANAPARARPLILWQALVPSRADLLIDHPNEAGQPLLRLRVQRLMRGVLAFPRAARALGRVRTLRRGAVISAGLELEQSAPINVESPLSFAPREDEGAKELAEIRPCPVDLVRDEREASTVAREAPPRLHDASLLVRSDRVAWTQSKDEVFVVDLASAYPRPVALAGTSTFFWDLLEERQTIGDVLDAASEAFGVEQTAVEGDVLTFLVSLEAEGIIQFV